MTALPFSHVQRYDIATYKIWATLVRRVGFLACPHVVFVTRVAALALQTGRYSSPICGARGHAGMPAMDPVPTAARRLQTVALLAQDSVPCLAAVWPLVLEQPFGDDDADTKGFAARRRMRFPRNRLLSRPSSAPLAWQQGWTHISYRLLRSTATVARGTPPSAP